MFGLADSETTQTTQTTRRSQAPKGKDKTSAGVLNGQRCVFLLLVTPRGTIPGGVEFSRPEPLVTAWHTAETRLRTPGVPRQQRPVKPRKNPNSPTKPEMAWRLWEAFHAAVPRIAVRCVLADTRSGTPTFLDTASARGGACT